MRLGMSKSRARAKLWLARAGGDARATTAVEFALVAPLVIALILGAMQIAVIYLAQAELENAAEQAARLVLTNQAPASGSAGQASFQTAVCGYLPALFTCSGVMVDLQAQAISAKSSDALVLTPPTLTYGSSGQVTNAWNYNPGSPGTAHDPQGDVPVAGRRRAARPRLQRSGERNAVHQLDPGLPERE